MGVVYMAFHTDLGRHCALKVLKLTASDEDGIQRFVREGRSAAKLGKHPNIAQVFDAGVADETPYIAMEFVVGTPLDQLLADEGAMDVAQVLEIGRKVALALDHAHGCGIVHRDMKPANVILDKHGEPQILDFGLAKDTANNVELSRADTILGTPAYMPPEQAQPGLYPVDRRSDVYSLCAALHTMLVGKPPFRGESMVDTIVKVILEDPPSLVRNAKVSPDVEAVIEKGMEKDPSRRYQTALELADDLSRLIAGEEPRVRPLGTFGRLWRRIRRNRAAFTMVAVASLALLALFGFLAYRLAERGQAMLRRSRAATVVGKMYGNEGAQTRIHTYRRAIEADPTWGQAYFLLGVAYLDRALELDSEDTEAAKEHRLQAIATLNDGIDRGLGAVGYYQRGNSYEEMRLRKLALADFKKAAELSPGDVFGLQAACGVALMEGRYEDAERLGSDLLVQEPDNDITYWRRGSARKELGQLDEGYDDAVRAVELWEQEPEYHLLAAQIARQRGDLRGYGRHLWEGRAFNADHTMLLSEASHDALIRGDLERAEKLAERAVAVDQERPRTGEGDRTPEPLMARARVRRALGRESEAQEDFAAAIVTGDFDGHMLAEANDPGREPAKTEAGLAEAVTLAAEAKARFDSGDYERALVFARRALRLDPLSRSGLSVLSSCLAAVGDGEGAEEALERSRWLNGEATDGP
jgi:tetratricopeptide (TPR) repeat protein/predicted Ser/Thr protein kinase